MRMVFPNPTSARLMDDLATDVGTLVESFFGDGSERSGRSDRQSMRAPLDIEESGDAYLVTMDVPGVSIDSVEINVHEDTLVIQGERGCCGAKTSDEPSCEQDASEFKLLRRERSSGKFERKIELPLAIEADQVSADLKDGVLTVRLPKADPEKGKRRVPISRG